MFEYVECTHIILCRLYIHLYGDVFTRASTIAYDITCTSACITYVQTIVYRVPSLVQDMPHTNSTIWSC